MHWKGFELIIISVFKFWGDLDVHIRRIFWWRNGHIGELV